MVNKNMQAAVLKGVEEQISADEPKGITQVFNRLKKEGYTELESKKMIGAVFLNDFYYMVQAGELFDSEGYMAKLEKLPGYYYKLMEGTDGVEAVDPFDYDNYYMEPSDGIEWDEDDFFEDDFRQEPVRSEKVGRNEPCPCESGKKYKKCCGKGA